MRTIINDLKTACRIINAGSRAKDYINAAAIIAGVICAMALAENLAKL